MNKPSSRREHSWLIPFFFFKNLMINSAFLTYVTKGYVFIGQYRGSPLTIVSSVLNLRSGRWVKEKMELVQYIREFKVRRSRIFTVIDCY